MHDDRELVEQRVTRTVNAKVRPAVFAPAIPMEISAFVVPGEPVDYATARVALYEPFSVGTKWGRPWGTTWFRLRGDVPATWEGSVVEACINLGFIGGGPGFQAEGLVWNDEGPRCGVHPRRRAVPLPEARPGQRVELLVEAASNPSLLGMVPTPIGSLRTAGDAPLYTFRQADLAVRNLDVDALVYDIEVLLGTMKLLSIDDPRRHKLLRSLERAMDRLVLDDIVGSARAARAELSAALAVPARASAHRIVAVGHAHIDTAWLWPLRETVRKCTRTFASVVELMDEYPEFNFVCSQAAQYAWIEEQQPSLFARILEKARAGRWQPVGAMWVEADMNLPSGESIARQLVHGQRYFESRFGRRCDEVWIPDVFGYPGSLPQIFALGGCDRFVTQKLSWNKQNRMPHHTFWWEGIDGSRVLTHFPPVDTYNADVTPAELAYASANFSDKGWSDWSLMPFGYGDGGGGPTRDMLERARRVANLDGLPRVEIGTPTEFFEHIEAEAEREPVPQWRGELYFEMHRGTFTTQANTKVGNRRCEHLLREAELWWATLSEDVATRLDALWKEVLLLQFHDILPGSSIAWVYEDAEAAYARIAKQLEELIEEALRRLVSETPAIANAATHARDEVVVTAIDELPGGGAVQQLADGRSAFRVQAPGLGLAPATALPPDDEVVVDAQSMRNRALAIAWDEHGRLTSMRDVVRDRELVPHGTVAAAIELAPDFPVEYDAWDVERWARRSSDELDVCEAIEVIATGPLVGIVRVRRAFGRSTLVSDYILRSGSARLDVAFDIDWHEDEKLLSVAFPIAVHADVVNCDIQFGHVARPTHTNTSWDAAKFEVCAHRWVDIAEPSFGVAVLNNGRYGHAVHDGAIRVSLLRAPKWPAPDADRGRHQVIISVLPHGPGLHDVLHEAEALNLPLRLARGTAHELALPIVRVDHPGVLVSAVKTADDGSGDLVVRLYEACGDRAAVDVELKTPLKSARRCNLLEEPLMNGEDGLVLHDGVARLVLGPFEIVTLRMSS